MAAASAREIVVALIDAFRESGVRATLASPQQGNPRRLVLDAPGAPEEVWIHVWTLTHGGRASLPDELRIQMTGVRSPLASNPGGPTLLLGYHPETESFAGFDLSRHTDFTAGSPSVQVGITCLFEARQNGLAFAGKSNREIAVGVRPDQLLNYMLNAEDLHRHGRRSAVLRMMQRAAALEDFDEGSLDALAVRPRRIVARVARFARSANFRQQVLAAYDNRCAVTRVQLKLVEAAHILPIHAPGTVDQVRNGIALSPTYHSAFDSGLIYLDTDLVMRLNEGKMAELRQIGRAGGIRAFKVPLDKPIHLPAHQRLRPAAAMIRRANRFRGLAQ